MQLLILHILKELDVRTVMCTNDVHALHQVWPHMQVVVEVKVVGQTSQLIPVEALVPSYPSVWSYAVVYAATTTLNLIPQAPPDNIVFHHEWRWFLSPQEIVLPHTQVNMLFKSIIASAWIYIYSVYMYFPYIEFVAEQLCRTIIFC